MKRVALVLVLAGCGNVVVSFADDGGGARASCSPSAPCAAPLACSAAGECVECVSDAQCSGATPACDVPLGRCVACRGAVGCVAPAICSPTRPVCVMPCQDQAQCPGFIDGCRSNACSACNDDEDCGAGRFCDRPVGRCVSCLVNEHCSGATSRCDTTLGVCRECLTNEDCSPASACYQGTCRAAR